MPTHRHLRIALAASTAALLAVTGCGGDDGDGKGETSSTTTTTVAAPSSTPSTEPEETTTSGPSRPTGWTDTARDAVDELVAAWEAGDRARAEAIAPGDAVDALFHLAPGGFEVYGCDTGEFETSTCNLRNRGTGVVVGVTAARGEAGWQIATLIVSEG